MSVDDGAAKRLLPADNELFAERAESAQRELPGGGDCCSPSKGPHTPGLWVLYFSLAALPLFGIGQHWIPAGDVGRRRYAFGLLAVYVAAGAVAAGHDQLPGPAPLSSAAAR